MTTAQNPHTATHLPRFQFLSLLAGTLETLLPSLRGHHPFLDALLVSVNMAVLTHVELAVADREFVPLPAELSRKEIAALHEQCSAIKSKSSLPEYALVNLLHYLQQLGLITCPMPRVRLETERDLAAALHPDRLQLLSRAPDCWSKILEQALAVDLPRKNDRHSLQQALNEAAYLTLLALIMEGDLLLSHTIQPLTHIRLIECDIEHGFIQIPLDLRRRAKTSRHTPDSNVPRFLTEPFWLNPLAQLLLLRYIRMRLLWGHQLGEPLSVTDPRARLFHQYVSSHPKQFSDWLKRYRTTLPPHEISVPLVESLSVQEPKPNRSLLGRLVDARRAHRLTVLGPIFTAWRSRLISTRPPTRDSWNRVILGKNMNSGHGTGHHIAPQPIKSALPIVATRPISSAYRDCPDHHTVLAACRPILQPLHHRVNELLRPLGKKSRMPDRISVATTVEAIAQTLPLLPATNGCSRRAPLSNFRIQLEWLACLLTTRYPGPEGLAPVSVKGYYQTIQSRLIECLGARNILSLSNPDDVGDVVADMLDAQLDGETLRTQRSHFVRLFVFLHANHGVAEVDLSNDELWIGTETHPFPLLSPYDIDACIDKLAPPDNIAIILGSYAMARRGEMCHLLLGDLLETADDLRLSIRTSKTRAGIRHIPLWALVPARHRHTLLEYRKARLLDARSSSPLREPFLIDEGGQPLTESALGDRIRRSMGKEELDIGSLHPLRHQGASWFPLVWYCAFCGLPNDRLGFDFSHTLFTPAHLAQFRQLFLPVPEIPLSNGHPCATDPFHVLSRCMGHSQPLMSIQRYVHTLSFLEYLIIRNSNHTPSRIDRVTRTKAARLLACSPSEITRLLKGNHQGQPHGSSQGGRHEEKMIPSSEVLTMLRTMIEKCISRNTSRGTNY